MRVNRKIYLFLGLCTFLFVFAAESFALQYARPVSDIKDGNWSPTTLYTSVDESTPNDGDYISTSTRDDIAELGLGTVTPPDTGTQTFRIRARSNDRFNALEVTLLSNGFTVQQFTINLSRWSYTTEEVEITNTIPNYESLSVKLAFKKGGGWWGGGSAYVSWIELEVPDPPPVTAPTLSTPTSSAITLDSATLGATITNTGSSNVTERGVVWSISPNPTIASYDGRCFETSASFGTGAFTCDATGLSLDTSYYFAGYAKNSQGYGYSGQGQFATLDMVRIGHNYDVAPIDDPGSTMIDCNRCHGLHGSSMVPTANEVFTACSQCHNATGSASNMSDIANHVVTRESDGVTVTVDCGKCHEVHKNPLVSADIHAGGATTRNKSYIRVDMTKYISGAYDGDTIYHNNFNGIPIPGEQPRTYSYGNSDAPFNGVCQSCHTDTKYHKNDGTAADHKKDTNCTGCHVHFKSGTNEAFLGRGHASSDSIVQNSPNCSSCHPTPNGDPVLEIHRENCSTCHVNPAGDGPLWEPWESMAPVGGVYDCENCHFTGGNRSQRATGHHNFERTVPPSAVGNGLAQKGQCINCHEADVGQSGTSRTAGNLDMPTNLACNWCHLFWGGGNTSECNTVGSDDCGSDGYKLDTDGKVKIFSLDWDPNEDRDGVADTANLPAQKTAIPSHTISKTTSPPISDYAACFACHGASAATDASGKQAYPFHGFGPGYQNDSCAGGGWGGGSCPDATTQANIYAGPTRTGTSNSQTYGRHPGWGNLDPEMHYAMRLGDGRNSDGDDAYSTRRIFDQSNARGSFTYTTTFSVPWDGYNSNEVTGPRTITIDLGWYYGNTAITTRVPLVPLTLTP